MIKLFICFSIRNSAYILIYIQTEFNRLTSADAALPPACCVALEVLQCPAGPRGGTGWALMTPCCPWSMRSEGTLVLPGP